MRRLLAPLFACLLGSCTLDLGDDDGDPGSGRQCGGFAGFTCDDDEYCDYTFADCGIADGGGFCTERPRICPEIYQPVRGSDGEIYGNACEAHASGVDDCGPAR